VLPPSPAPPQPPPPSASTTDGPRVRSLPGRRWCQNPPSSQNPPSPQSPPSPRRWHKR
jgi:hypothetical protein